MSLRSPLSRVLGSGSAREGTDHWWQQRVSAVGLVLLGAWFLVSFAGLTDYRQETLQAWVGAPLNALLLLLTVIALARHSSLGVQVIIEDYIHGTGPKVTALLLNKFIHAFLALGAALAILKIALGGSL